MRVDFSNMRVSRVLVIFIFRIVSLTSTDLLMLSEVGSGTRLQCFGWTLSHPVMFLHLYRVSSSWVQLKRFGYRLRPSLGPRQSACLDSSYFKTRRFYFKTP